jgi:hypothetical protein
LQCDQSRKIGRAFASALAQIFDEKEFAKKNARRGFRFSLIAKNKNDPAE